MSTRPSPEISHRETLGILVRALRYVGPFRWQFAVKAGLLFASVVPMLLVPWPIKILIDHVIEKIPIEGALDGYPTLLRPLVAQLAPLDTTGILVALFVFLIVLLLVGGAFGSAGGERDRADARMANGYDTATRTENEANEGWSFAGGLLGLLDFRYTLRLTQAFNHHYRRALFERIQALPITAFDDEKIGDAVYRVMYDTPAITNACYRIILTPLAAPLLIVLVALFLRSAYGDHPVLYWSALAFIPLALCVSLPMAGLVRRRAARSRHAGAVTTSTAEEGMANILAVQSLGGEARQRGRFDSDSWDSFGAYRSFLLAGIATFLLAAIPGIVLVGYAFLYVTDLVTEGVLTRGDFALLFGYYLRIAFTAVDLGGLWFSVQGNAAGLQRVFFLMDLPGERDRDGGEVLEGVNDGVRIEGVEFDYPDGSPALRDVDLEARVGEMVAFVGPAGAGKTTLAYLIPRFLEPRRGSVRIDGRDASRLTLDSLRAQVAFVFQETVLFDATVEENIRIGRPEASDADVERAARLAGALEFIERLPQGFQTPLGRSGGKLSTGQKQRLAIARALVREAPILILDEPTSALDPDTEQQLVRTLDAIRGERLIIVIAHRLSTVLAADQIVFLEDGRIVERGRHDDLVARPQGAYRRFIELQTRGAA
ncbi:MAG: ABC transporter ATP-binding protein [Myxococcota bacterium]